MELSARVQANDTKSPVYVYQFNCSGDVVPSYSYVTSKNTTKYGVCHGDDLVFIFSYSIGKDLPKISKKDEEIKEFMLDMWVSFAKTGKPGINNWKPVSKNINEDFNYYYISANREETKTKTIKEMGKTSFWLNLPFEDNQN